MGDQQFLMQSHFQTGRRSRSRMRTGSRYFIRTRRRPSWRPARYPQPQAWGILGTATTPGDLQPSSQRDLTTRSKRILTCGGYRQHATRRPWEDFPFHVYAANQGSRDHRGNDKVKKKKTAAVVGIARKRTGQLRYSYRISAIPNTRHSDSGQRGLLRFLFRRLRGLSASKNRTRRRISKLADEDRGEAKKCGIDFRSLVGLPGRLAAAVQRAYQEVSRVADSGPSMVDSALQIIPQ